GLPALPAINLGDLTGRLQDITNIDQLAPRQLSSLLEQARLNRITAFLRQNRAIAADDGRGRPAVRGVLIVSGADDAAIARAEAAGFRLLDRETVAGLDLNYAR